MGLRVGELLAVKEVAMNVEGAHQKEAVEQLEHEVRACTAVYALSLRVKLLHLLVKAPLPRASALFFAHNTWQGQCRESAAANGLQPSARCKLV